MKAGASSAPPRPLTGSKQMIRTLSAEEFISIANAHGRGVDFRRFWHAESGQYVTFPVLNGSFRPFEDTTDWMEYVREELLGAFYRRRKS